ncbi:MAG: hypothetical protein ABFD50_18625 [Smithella sp.]
MTNDIKYDLIGRELAIGDYVAFQSQGYRGLQVGKIASFTPKQVRVKGPGIWDTDRGYLQYPRDLVKLDGPDFLMHMLKRENPI